MQKIQFSLDQGQWHDFFLAHIMRYEEHRSMDTRIQTLLAHLPDLGKVRTQFFLHIVTLFLSLPSRINFLNMARYGIYSEKTYRTHFEQPFAFWDFNVALIQQVCGPHQIIVIKISNFRQGIPISIIECIYYAGLPGFIWPFYSSDSLCFS